MYDDESTEPCKAIGPQPTELYMVQDNTQEFLPAQPMPTTPFAQGGPTVPLQSTTTPLLPPATLSRRKFMGVPVAGLAAIGGASVAATVGDAVLAQLIQNGGLKDAFHGPLA